MYVGNLSFYTEEEQIYALFSMCGPVRRIIMGIHKFNKTPCGFCFVELSRHTQSIHSPIIRFHKKKNKQMNKQKKHPCANCKNLSLRKKKRIY